MPDKNYEHEIKGQIFDNTYKDFQKDAPPTNETHLERIASILLSIEDCHEQILHLITNLDNKINITGDGSAEVVQSVFSANSHISCVEQALYRIAEINDKTSLIHNRLNVLNAQL